MDTAKYRRSTTSPTRITGSKRRYNQRTRSEAPVKPITMVLGLMRWPSVHWHLAQLHLAATGEQQQVIAAVFDGLNAYLGNYIGEFLGELSFSMFFLLSSWTLLRSRTTPAWVAVVGLA